MRRALPSKRPGVLRVPTQLPGVFVFIDRADRELVGGHVWTAVQSRPGATHYAISRIDGKYTYMHNLITGQKGWDHANGNGLDNRRANLRPATPTQQNANQTKRQTQNGSLVSSRYRGVARNGRGWMALCGPGSVNRYVGQFATEEEAALAYNQRATQLWGEYARLNDLGPPQRRPRIVFLRNVERPLAWP